MIGPKTFPWNAIVICTLHKRRCKICFYSLLPPTPPFMCIGVGYIKKKISGWVKEEVPTFHVDVLFTKDIEGGKGEEGRKYKEISVPLRFRTNQLFT